MAEVGLDLNKFATSKNFVSWLGLCPNKKITGGKVISSKTSKNTGRLSKAFRDCANVVGNQKNTFLSDRFKSLSYRKGRAVAITATASKIATIVFNMLKHREAYKPFDVEEQKKIIRNKKIKNMRKTMKSLGITTEELV